MKKIIIAILLCVAFSNASFANTFARIKAGEVKEILTVPSLPPFHQSLIWVECNSSVKVGWSYNGSVFSAPSDTDPERLKAAKATKRGEYKGEAVSRIAAQVPEWDTYATVAFMASIWNLMNGGSATTSQNNAKGIYLYAKNTAIPNVNAQTSVSAVQSIDVQSDPGWPQ